jgi:hypothetical protein
MFIGSFGLIKLFYQASAFEYSSIGKQLQTKFRSPYALSTRLTLGQNFASFTNGSGYAAFCLE